MLSLENVSSKVLKDVRIDTDVNRHDLGYLDLPCWCWVIMNACDLNGTGHRAGTSHFESSMGSVRSVFSLEACRKWGFESVCIRNYEGLRARLQLYI